MSLYESMENEVISLEEGGRVARNHIAVQIADLGQGKDRIWSYQCLMFCQVAQGLRHYGKRAPRNWLPDPAALR